MSIARIICFMIGHRWVYLFKSSWRYVTRQHLHPMAGTDHFCARCGSVWDDAYEDDRRQFYMYSGPPVSLNPYREVQHVDDSDSD